MITMTKNNNPWDEMHSSSIRRIKNESIFDIFWFKDLDDSYGIRFLVGHLLEDIDKPIKLDGISIIKMNKPDKGELFLILRDKEDLELFTVLCKNLIDLTGNYDSEKAMMKSLENRLIRWQKLLKEARKKIFSTEKQMGLITELTCLKNVIAPRLGLSKAVIAWVGCEADKQDFALENLLIEVKSYRTTKGPKVNINSVLQLFSEKEPLYLITYGITKTLDGLNVDDLIISIREQLSEEPKNVLEEFDNKLYDFGYIPELIDNELDRFSFDKIKTYYVSKTFPVVDPRILKSEIFNLKYSLDLTDCQNHIVELNSIFKAND
jgi:hypothetical protein